MGIEAWAPLTETMLPQVLGISIIWHWRSKPPLLLALILSDRFLFVTVRLFWLQCSIIRVPALHPCCHFLGKQENKNKSTWHWVSLLQQGIPSQTG
jgi:hypothetical protein